MNTAQFLRAAVVIRPEEHDNITLAIIRTINPQFEDMGASVSYFIAGIATCLQAVATYGIPCDLEQVQHGEQILE